MRLVRALAWSPFAALIVTFATIAAATAISMELIPSGFWRQAASLIWLVPGMAYFGATLRRRRRLSPADRRLP